MSTVFEIYQKLHEISSQYFSNVTSSHNWSSNRGYNLIRYISIMMNKYFFGLSVRADTVSAKLAARA